MHMKSTYKYHLVRQFSIACMYTFLWMTTLYLTTSTGLIPLEDYSPSLRSCKLAVGFHLELGPHDIPPTKIWLLTVVGVVHVWYR